MLLVEAPTGVAVTDAPPPLPTRPSLWRRVGAGATPYLFLVPALVSVAIWVYRPMVDTARLSFVQWNLMPTRAKVPVGWQNYRDVLELPEMHTALANTAKYVLGLLPFSVVIPLAIALLIGDGRGRGRGFYRTAIFLPVLIAPVVVAAVWRWILHPSQGVLDGALGLIGVDGPDWLGDRRLALWTIVAITGWKLIGFSVLIFSAGIAGLDRDLLAAAEVDGASRWQVTRHVTLPLLSPSILFMVLLTVLLSAQWTFPLVNVLTDGGPLGATTNIYLLLWEYGFRNFNVGFSSAAAVLFFCAFGLLALGCVKAIDRFSFHDS